MNEPAQTALSDEQREALRPAFEKWAVGAFSIGFEDEDSILLNRSGDGYDDAQVDGAWMGLLYGMTARAALSAAAPTKAQTVNPPEFQEVSWGVDAVMRPVKGMAVSEYAFREWAKANGITLAGAAAPAATPPNAPPNAAEPAQEQDGAKLLAWEFTGQGGLKRFLTQRQYEAQTPGTQKWYRPICPKCGPRCMSASPSAPQGNAGEKAAIPHGWKLVPEKPTLRQMAAMGPAIRACYELDGVSGNVSDVYRAMLAASPTPPSAGNVEGTAGVKTSGEAKP